MGREFMVRGEIDSLLRAAAAAAVLLLLAVLLLRLLCTWSAAAGLRHGSPTALLPSPQDIMPTLPKGNPFSGLVPAEEPKKRR